MTSFSDLRSMLGRTSGPISLSDIYDLDVLTPSTGTISVKNTVGVKPAQDLYQTFHPSTRNSTLGMYSTRLINALYTGPIIQVKRSNDNEILDFYADLNGNLKDKTFSSSYASWIGANVGYVTKWYDQSGAGLHAVNSSSPAIPPRLVRDPTGCNRYVLFFPNSKVPDPDLKIQVSFNSTFPTYNSLGGTAPSLDISTQNSNYVKFSPGAVQSSSSSCQYMSFGPQTLNLQTKGFTMTCRFMFTSLGSWERLIQLHNTDNTNYLFISRPGTSEAIVFGVRSNNVTTIWAIVSPIVVNTVYNIAFVYDPLKNPEGWITMYVNGSKWLDAANTSTTKPQDASYDFCWVGRSYYDANMSLNANIYSLKVYNRVLSEAEILDSSEYGNNYSGLLAAPQNVGGVLCSFYPIMNNNTYHTLLCKDGEDTSLRFWANPNAVAGGPWPVGSSNNPNYKAFGNSGDFMYTSGGYGVINNLHLVLSPYAYFRESSWHTLCCSKSSSSISVSYIGQHYDTTLPSRAFYGYIQDLITFGSSLPVYTINGGSISPDYRFFAKRFMGGNQWTNGLVGRYTCDSWIQTAWLDTSGSNNHATSVVNGASILTNNNQYLSGDTSTSISFPSAIMSSTDYTLFHVAKYNGANKKNIITSAWSDPDLIVELSYISTTPGYTSAGGTLPSWSTGSGSGVFFTSGNILCNSPSCQHLNYGSRTCNIGSKGFSAYCYFAFTGATLNTWERLFDFGNGAGNDNILLTRNLNGNTLRFQYFNGSTVGGTLDTTYTFSQSTLYSIAVVYDPSAGSNGTMYFYVGGVLQQTFVPSVKAVDRTVSTSYIGKSTWTTLDYAFNGVITMLKIFNRPLSASEIASFNQYPSTTWISGHYKGLAGFAYHSLSDILNTYDLHGSNWVVSSDRNQLYRSNAGQRMVSNLTSANTYPLTITVNGLQQEASDWAVACIIAFNRVLSSTDCLMIEDHLASRYSIPIPVLDNLICSLDASEYVATRDTTTWKDRINGYNFTLTSASAYNNSGPVPYMSFNNSYTATRAAIPLPTSPAYITIVMWVQMSTNTSNYRSFGVGTNTHFALVNSSHILGYWGDANVYPSTAFVSYDNDVNVSNLSEIYTRMNMFVFQLSTSPPYVQFIFNPVSLPLYRTGYITNNVIAKLQEGVVGISTTTQGCGNVGGVSLYNKKLSDEDMVDTYNRFAARYSLPTDTTYHSLYSPNMWFRARDLTSSLSQGASVSTWKSSGPVWTHTATGYAAGTGTIPTFDKTSETLPFVRLGTNTNSTSNGGYFNCGSKTFNLAVTGGFTVVAHIRFRVAAHQERIIDFGSATDSTNNNVTLTRAGTSSGIYGIYAVGTTSVQSANITNVITGSWQTICMRITEKDMKFFYGTSKYHFNHAIGLSNRTVTNTFIGKSCWPSSDNYANFDIRDLLIYDRALSDTQIANVRSYLDINKIPPSVKTTLDSARNEIITSGLQLWLDMGLQHTYDPERSATTLYDLSGNNNNFTLNGAGYKFDKAGFLNLSNTSTTYGVGPSGNKFNITIDHTVEFCVYNIAGTNNQFLRITSGTSTGYNSMIAIYMLHTDNNIYYDTLAIGSLNRCTYTASSSSGYRHMVARCRTINGTTSTELFENNVRKAGPVTISPAGTWTGITRLFSAENNAYNFGNANFYFLRIYNRALTDAEIAQNYTVVQSKYF